MTNPTRPTGHSLVARDLGIAIVTGQVAPATILPSEHEIALQRGCSRGVVREALRMLSAKGLIASRPKAGTRVRDRADWNLLDPDIMAWMFEGEPPASFIDSLFQLRMIVEPAAAELAALSRTSRQLSRIGQALEQMTLHGLDTPAGQAADQQFHHVILEATGNELLVSLAGSIGAAVRWTTIFKHRRTRQPRDSIPQHGQLFDAIARCDTAGARAATVELLRQAKEDTERSLGDGAAPE